MKDNAKVSRRLMTDGTNGIDSIVSRMNQILERLPPGESLLDYAARRDEIVRDSVNAISDLTAGFDAFDIIELMRQREIPFTLTGYKESQHDGLVAAIEITALIILSRGSRSPVTRNTGGAHPNAIINQLHEHASTILQVGSFAIQAEGVNEQNGPLARLSAEYRARALYVRNKQYDHIQDQLNEELFGSSNIEDLINNAVGFSYEDMVIIRQAISEAYARGLGASREALAEIAIEWAGNRDEGQESTRLEQGATAFRDMFVYSGQRASFTAEEIAQRTGLSVPTCETILQFFSASFTECDPFGSALRFLDGKNPFFGSSLITDGEGNFIVVSAPIGTDYLRYAAEEALKGTGAWRRYDRHRTRVSESLSVEYLENVLQAKATYTHFKYYAPKKGIDLTALSRNAINVTSIGNEVEADALFLIEDVAICVEVKGRSISSAARQGRVRSLSKDLERTIGEATTQAHRLEDLIAQNRGLWLPDRSWLDLDHIREIRSIAICLDDMGPLAIALDELVRNGIIEEHRFPWIVSLHDLGIITEVLDRPAEFLLYLRRRTGSGVSKLFSAADELDLFMLFISGGLYVEPDPDKVYEDYPTSGKPTAVARKRYRNQSIPTRIGTYTDPLDAWIYFQEGSSFEEVDKPAFSANSKILEIVDFLQVDRKPGWFRFASDLLNLSSEAQKGLAAHIDRVLSLTRTDHSPHSLVECYAGAWGFPSLFVYSRPRGMGLREARERMAGYVTLKKHQLRSDRALGILYGEDSNILAVQYFNEPPIDNSELDELGKEAGLVPIERMGRVIPPSARRSTQRLRGKRGRKKRR